MRLQALARSISMCGAAVLLVSTCASPVASPASPPPASLGRLCESVVLGMRAFADLERGMETARAGDEHQAAERFARARRIAEHGITVLPPAVPAEFRRRRDRAHSSLDFARFAAEQLPSFMPIDERDVHAWESNSRVLRDSLTETAAAMERAGVDPWV